MKKLSLLFLAALYVPALAHPPSSRINFISGNLEEVQQIAAREGKPLFVHFTATWCMPCQWMEKNTFNDGTLAAYANDHYLALKIDIDNASGLFYKEQLHIKHLPSMLFYNSQGTLLERKEESLDPEHLLELLRRHNNPQNHIRTKLKQDPLILDSPSARLHVYRPALIPESTPPQIRPVIAPPPGTVVTSTPDNYYPPPTSSAATSFLSAPRSLKEFAIQVGVFSDYQNAVRETSRLEKTLDQPVNLLAAEEKGRMLYRILIGRFPSDEKARQYLLTAKKNGLQGFVREL
jgi:thioredoxin-related protein